MAKRKEVLFITDCEYGQSNVVLAVAHDLLLRNEVDVHIASWIALKPRIIQLQDRICQENPTKTVSPITFHNLPGLSMFESWLNETGYTKSRMCHAPGIRGAAHLRTLLSGLLHAWNPNDYIALYDWCADFAATLDPAVIVLDPFVPAAHDMCRTVPRNYVVLSPCTLAAGIIPEQPRLAWVWKYPA
jgi:2-acylglycerol O-acyltransferase 1